MKKYISILNKTAIFEGLSIIETENILACLNPKVKNYKKDGIIIFAGDDISSVGIVLSGGVLVFKENYHGDKTILTELSIGGIFAETLVCAGVKKSPVFVMATQNTSCIFIEYKKIVNSCANSCGFHTKLIENMLKLIAQKSMFINSKMELLSYRTIRQKLEAFFEIEMQKAKTNQFKIKYKRQELADFLCIDRSALSRELCKMRDEGLIDFEKNYFKINE